MLSATLALTTVLSLYNNVSGLKRHTEVVHEGKELFNCDRCPKKFTYKNGLDYHFTLQHELRDKGSDFVI